MAQSYIHRYLQEELAYLVRPTRFDVDRFDHGYLMFAVAVTMPNDEAMQKLAVDAWDHAHPYTHPDYADMLIAAIEHGWTPIVDHCRNMPDEARETFRNIMDLIHIHERHFDFYETLADTIGDDDGEMFGEYMLDKAVIHRYWSIIRSKGLGAIDSILRNFMSDLVPIIEELAEPKLARLVGQPMVEMAKHKELNHIIARYYDGVSDRIRISIYGKAREYGNDELIALLFP